MKARLVFHEKRLVWSPSKGRAGIAELEVWEVPRSSDYPNGRKFSLFLVVDGDVVIGIDNHKPKGPHLHRHDQQHAILVADEEQLLVDFWELGRKGGFEP
jgi:hypothetical protein